MVLNLARWDYWILCVDSEISKLNDIKAVKIPKYYYLMWLIFYLCIWNKDGNLHTVLCATLFVAFVEYRNFTDFWNIYFIIGSNLRDVYYFSFLFAWHIAQASITPEVFLSLASSEPILHTCHQISFWLFYLNI